MTFGEMFGILKDLVTSRLTTGGQETGFHFN